VIGYVYAYMCMYECIYICIYVCIYTIAHVHNQDMLEEFEDVKVGVLAQEEWIRIYIYVLYMYIHKYRYRCMYIRPLMSIIRICSKSLRA